MAEKELEKVKIADEVTDVVCDAVRKKYGGQIRTARKIPGLPGLPGVQEHEAVSGEDRRAMSEVRKRRCPHARRRRAESITAARIIRSAILCPGRSPVAEKCPKCGGYMVEKGNKLALFQMKQCGYTCDRKSRDDGYKIVKII